MVTFKELEKLAKKKKIKFSTTAHGRNYGMKSDWGARMEFPESEEPIWVGSKNVELLKKRIKRELEQGW